MRANEEKTASKAFICERRERIATKVNRKSNSLDVECQKKLNQTKTVKKRKLLVFVAFAVVCLPVKTNPS